MRLSIAPIENSVLPKPYAPPTTRLPGQPVHRLVTPQPSDIGGALRLGVLSICLAALDIEPVNSHVAGFVAALTAAAAAVSSPAAWFFYTSASQVVADPAGAPLTLAQLSILLWLVSLPWNGTLPTLRKAWPYWSQVLPFLLWFYAVLAVNRASLPSPMFYATVTGFVCYLYARSRQVSMHTLLFALVAGLSYSLLGYWGRFLDLPVVSRTYISGGEGLVIERIGAGRGDANVVGLSLPVFIVGSLALSSLASEYFCSRATRRIVRLFGFTSLFVGVPPLLATVSRGGIYSFILSLAVCVLSVVVPRWRPRPKRWPVLASLCLAGTVPLTAYGIQLIRQSFQGIASRNAWNQTFSGSDSFFAGRARMWGIHWDLVVQHPLFGVGRGETIDFGEYGFAVVGIEGTYGAAHNVFLDIASSVGLPGLFLFALLFLSVPWRFYGRYGGRTSATFFLVYISVTLGFMWLSVANWKFYWALLGLMIAGASRQTECMGGRGPGGGLQTIRMTGTWGN